MRTLFVYVIPALCILGGGVLVGYRWHASDFSMRLRRAWSLLLGYGDHI